MPTWLPLPSRNAQAPRRPLGPRCRGGISSLLRLAQPLSAPGLRSMRAQATRGEASGSGTSIITRLLPSPEWAPPQAG